MGKQLLVVILVVFMGTMAFAQRNTDKLDRGLIAVKSSEGVFCSWRIFGEEYYDVTYNLYRDGQKVNEKPLEVSNFLDKSGTTSSSYTVKAVVRGKEETVASKVATVMETFYKEITPKHDASLKSTYIPNDICLADVDGDGEMELLTKYDNVEESAAGFPKEGNNGEYALLECVKQDGTVLWWINCGPNMGDFQNNEQNIAGYDWDKDGKAEIVLRLSEGSQIHKSDGSVYTVGGDGWTNHRIPSGGGQWFTYYGDEYLLYLEGATGNVYQCKDFPLKRYEDGETSLEAAWGDGYGHRQGKYFFGAPVLDGRNASIFLARGIYTRHKMIAYDVNPSTHELTVRWEWNCNSHGPWYAQGYHNYCIGDVDMDGRDEIVFGSMVIDDNGKGLSTTGLGHGDAEHLGDFNPYVHGLEFFACNEDNPNNNYRNATTSEIYYRSVGGRDDGRSICGNFSNDYYGALAYSSYDGGISCVANKNVGASGVGIATNFRIYWDGDLLEETFNYCDGKNSAGAIYKYGVGEIERLTGSMTNNDTKGTPCVQGDIYGDWREEVVMRTADNKIRIYTTTDLTEWRNYTLWHDHQYRNAMVWQMNGYNQPPHVSYFLGEKEQITMAPPPLTMEGREEVANAGSVSSSYNDKHVIICEPNDMTVSIEEGATPYILTINTPSWVQGTAPSNCTIKDTEIIYSKFTHTVTGAALGGETRLVKMGDGILNLPAVENTHSGSTDIWGGVVNFDGTMKNSRVWLNRHTTLNTAGTFNRKVSADYGSKIIVGGADNVAVANIDTLELNFGAMLSVDLYGGEEISSDKVVVKKLIFNKLDDSNAPMTYLNPIVEMTSHNASGEKTLTAGKYLICEFESMEGSVSDVLLSGKKGIKASLIVEENKLYVNVEELRGAQTIFWKGDVNGVWDLSFTNNFVDEEGKEDLFVTGDSVIIDDEHMVNNTISITESLMPKSLFCDNSTADVVIENDGFTGDMMITKNGTGTLSLKGTHTYTGGVIVNEGTLAVSSLPNSINIESSVGLHSSENNVITLVKESVLKPTESVVMGSAINIVDKGVIELTSSMTMDGVFKGDTLVKRGAGDLNVTAKNTHAKTIIESGSIVVTGEVGSINGHLGKEVEFINGALVCANDMYSYSSATWNILVRKGNTGKVEGDTRCDFKGKLSGEGTMNFIGKGTTSCPREVFTGDWSSFTGVINVTPGASGFYHQNSNGVKNAELNIVSGTYNASNPQSGATVDYYIGKLSGNGALGAAKTWNVGLSDEDFSFMGNILGGEFAKVGVGVMTYRVPKDKDNTMTAAYIMEGELYSYPQSLVGSKIVFGKGVLEIEAPGILSGYGVLANSTTNVSGVLYPGINTRKSPKTFDFSSKPVNINSGGELIFDLISNGKCSSISDISVLNLKKGSKLTVKLVDGYTPMNGDSFVVISDATTITIADDVDFNMPILSNGLVWDMSRVGEGVISIIEAETAIEHIAYDAIATCEVYSLLGVKVGEFTSVRHEAVAKLRQTVSRNGIYILKMSANGVTESIKVMK